MVKVLPFNGIIYDLNKVNIKDVIAPPYDVIDDEEQEKLYQTSPYNIIRLILNKIEPSDNEINNRYSRAAGLFKQWLNEGILKQLDEPFILYCIQNYITNKGEKVSRKGFIARNMIEEFDQRNVLPHEYTMGGPKEDRFKLTEACGANLSQVFFVYEDPQKEIDKAIKLDKEPLFEVTDSLGVQNIVYIIDDKEVLDKITKFMSDKSVLIADGHHRYETALAFRNYMREKTPDWKEEDLFNYVMCYYTNLYDEGSKVYPTHRIINRKIDTKKLQSDLEKYFSVSEYAFNEANRDKVKGEFVNKIEEISKDNIAFGLCLKDVNVYYIYELQDKDGINKVLEEKQVPEVLRKLDLSILHKLIISDYLKFSEEDQFSQSGIQYIKKEEEAFNAVESGSAEAVFVLASPKVIDIKKVSEAGFRMPQKSTYFYPKLLSGIVINPIY